MIEYSCDLRSKNRNFILKFSLELIKEYIDRTSDKASQGLSPKVVKYMGQASVARSKLIREYCNSNFIMHSSTEELLDVSFTVLSSLSYLVEKNETLKFELVQRIHQLGPNIMKNGSKLIQTRFVLLMGYYSDLFNTVKIQDLKSPDSNSQKSPRREGKSLKILKFEEILVFLCKS